jgi:hypothetical protein
MEWFSKTDVSKRGALAFLVDLYSIIDIGNRRSHGSANAMCIARPLESNPKNFYHASRT